MQKKNQRLALRAKNVESFLKDVKDESGKMVKWATTGLVATAALTAVLAFPVLAPAVGAAMGLSGAAATTAGLAFFGGGSIAAGGLGMAGGMTVLVGGGALLGAVGGSGVAKMLNKLPHEVLALDLAKTINFMEYLANISGVERPRAQQILSNTKVSFLDFKHSCEREILLGKDMGDKKENLQRCHILTYAYKKAITF